jgi:hypothetical protein
MEIERDPGFASRRFDPGWLHSQDACTQAVFAAGVLAGTPLIGVRWKRFGSLWARMPLPPSGSRALRRLRSFGPTSVAGRWRVWPDRPLSKQKRRRGTSRALRLAAAEVESVGTGRLRQRHRHHGGTGQTTRPGATSQSARAARAGRVSALLDVSVRVAARRGRRGRSGSESTAPGKARPRLV